MPAAAAQEPLFDDWLLVPGTAIHSKPMPDDTFVILNEAYAVARVSARCGPGKELVQWTSRKPGRSGCDGPAVTTAGMTSAGAAGQRDGGYTVVLPPELQIHPTSGRPNLDTVGFLRPQALPVATRGPTCALPA